MGLILLLGSCTGCKKEAPVEPNLIDTITIVETPALDVVHLTALDRQTMFAIHQDGNYRWYETDILMKNFLDEETNGEVEEMVNVFQYIIDYEDNSYDTKVYKFQHFANGVYAEDSIAGFWYGDFPLEDSLIKISYDSAFALVQEVNLPKPHSRYAVLRNPVGPKACNPQWIFGNKKKQIWVDATTGEIRQSSPAFPEGEGFKMPLGEWP